MAQHESGTRKAI